MTPPDPACPMCDGQGVKDHAALCLDVCECTAAAAPPMRVRLSRAKGWRLPANTVKVDRSTPWGNHIRVGDERGIGHPPWTAEDAVEQYREETEYLIDPDRPDGGEVLDLSPLRGRNLACWCALCPDHADGKPFGLECAACAPCHADVLLELASRGRRPIRLQPRGNSR